MPFLHSHFTHQPPFFLIRINLFYIYYIKIDKRGSMGAVEVWRMQYADFSIRPGPFCEPIIIDIADTLKFLPPGPPMSAASLLPIARRRISASSTLRRGTPLCSVLRGGSYTISSFTAPFGRGRSSIHWAWALDQKILRRHTLRQPKLMLPSWMGFSIASTIVEANKSQWV
ncbi:uncharacterized protein LOC122026958 isoform X2 [Zingiber officinale]|uniref:uncharacterized protein LOC122026958 isoform X2 n=1 Tax=Zingiber officinale TaxID=94328 RepID=UPI001C4D6D0D|nr:uncharacterized protein LOC122026958 isoform X2 [Zingiber officinale]